MVKSSFSSKCVSLLAGALRSYELGVDPPDMETDEIDASSLVAHTEAPDLHVAGMFKRGLFRISASDLPGDGGTETGFLFSHVKEDAEVMNVGGQAERGRASVTKPGQFIMDTAAGVSVANEASWMERGADMLHLPLGASSLSGVGGDKTQVASVSNLFEPLRRLKVNHAPTAVANIISVPDLQEHFYIHFRDQKTSKDRMEISTDPEGKEVIATAPKDAETRYYMLQAKQIKKPVFNIYSDAHANGWSKNAIERALRVRRLHRAFSYVDVTRLKNLVRSNRFGFDIGPREVALYERLHDAGECAACSLGKTTRADQVALDRTRATTVGELLIADIMEIKSKRLDSNKLVLVVVDEFSAYTIVKHLERKDIPNVITAFKQTFADFETFGWKVKAIKLDGDGTFREIAPYIAQPLGVNVIPTSPYKHAVVAERMIRTLTTLFRCTLAGLPYTLSPHMYVSLIDYCASSNNLVPNDHNPVLSPTELFTRSTPEYEKLARVEYGQLVTFHHDSSQNDEMRAKVGVIVGRDIRRPGHAIIWNLLDKGTVARNDFKPLQWNQALLRAYLDAAMVSHDAQDQAVERSAYYEPSDVEMSHGDLISQLADRLGVISHGTEYDSEDRPIEIARSKEDHRRALQRLTDVANASGHLLEEEEEGIEHDVRLDPADATEVDEARVRAESFGAEEEPVGEIRKKKSGDAKGSGRATEVSDEISHLRDQRLKEIRKNAKSQNPETLRSIAARIKELEAEALSQEPKTSTVFNLSIMQAFDKLGEAEVAKALLDELLQMPDKEVWEVQTKQQMKELYRLGKVRNILPCSVFLKEKYDADKRFLKLKARLVAHGNRQILDEIFGAKDVDSPTVSLAAVNMLLHMAAAGGWKKRVVDVAGAYLNATLKTPEYMRIPAKVVDIIEGYMSSVHGADSPSAKQDDGSIIVRLKKALYGLRQAGREWYVMLSTFLTAECGYTVSCVDKCVFSRIADGVVSYIAVYVDDLLMVSNEDKEISRITHMLEEKFKSITIQEGPDISFVGMQIHTEANGDVKVRQRGYIVDIIDHFGVDPSETADYPWPGNVVDKPDTNGPDCEVEKFKSGVMKLMYLSTRTRPDIAFAVSVMASRAERPKASDWERLVQIVRYLNSTKDDHMVYKYGVDIALSAFVDASFMTHRDMRSHTGYAIFADVYGGAAVVYRSVKQKTVADSSTEAEVIAIHELVQHLLWVISLYESIGVEVQKPVPVHNDNKSNLLLHSKDHVNFKGRSKYIARKYFSVFEHVEDGTLSLVWTGTDDLVADFLTKAIKGGKFSKFKIQIGLSQ